MVSHYYCTDLMKKGMFDVEKFINLIKTYPCIWNVVKHGGDHSERKKAWEVIAKAMYPTWGSFPSAEKQLKMSYIQKKWKYIRDYFVKQRKSDQMCELDPSIPPLKKRYVYTHLLYFLDDTPIRTRFICKPNNNNNNSRSSEDGLSLSPTHQSTPSDKDENSSSMGGGQNDEDTLYNHTSDECGPTTIKFESFEEPAIDDGRLMPSASIEHHHQDLSLPSTSSDRSKQDIDEDEMFLLSLLPAMRTLSPLEKMNFRLEVLNSLKKIQFPAFNSTGAAAGDDYKSKE